MTDKEIISVVQAHSEGKTIQFWDEPFQEWLDCSEYGPCLNFSVYKYRVKPESKIRPYKNSEECWNDMQKHHPFGWLKLKDSSSYITLSLLDKYTNFEFDFRNYTYADGAPFGIVEEE